MAISNHLKSLLEKKKIDYQVLEHEPTFTALETAQAQHIPGRQLVKSVVVKADGKAILCVLSAVQNIDFSKLRTVLGCKEVHLADENSVAALFPEYDLGAEPPIPNRQGISIIVDKMLEENESIVFNAGTHQDMVRIKFKDYIGLVKPQFADFGIHL